MERIKGRDSDQRERRKFSRIEDNIFIFCKFKPDYRATEWIAKDVSEMGLRFESDKFIRPSTFMEIQIYQPLDYLKGKIVSIYVLANVVWVKEIKKGSRCKESNRYIAGVEFTKISKQDRSIIANYVKERFNKRDSSL